MQRERRTRARRDSSSSPTGTPASLCKMVRGAIVLNLAALDRTYFSIGAGVRLGKRYLSTPPAAQSPGRPVPLRTPGLRVPPRSPITWTRLPLMGLPDVTPGMPSRLPEEPGSAGARSLARNATGVPQSSHQLGQGVGPRTSIGQATDRFPRPVRARGHRPDSAAQYTSTTQANPDVRSDAVRLRQAPQ